jgi:tetratricopeptide (TPR) repeat protein
MGNKNMQTDNEKAALAEAKSGRTLPRTQLGDLRDLLATIEKRVAKLKEIDPEEALEILWLFDQAQRRLTALASAGVNVGSEETHFESLLMQFRNHDSLFIRCVGGSAALRQARQDQQPDEDHWWWYVDEALASQRKSTLLRWAFGILVLVVVALGFRLIYQRFLAPDPAIQASYGLQQNAENALIAGDPQLALENVNKALIYTPDDADLYLLQGVIYQTLDNPDAAEKSFEAARQKYEGDEIFYAERAGLYAITGQADLALEDANAAIEINPDLAYAHIYRAQAYETMGNFSAALDDYELASEIAERTGDAEIQVFARMQMAQLLERGITLETESP